MGRQPSAATEAPPRAPSEPVLLRAGQGPEPRRLVICAAQGGHTARLQTHMADSAARQQSGRRVGGSAREQATRAAGHDDSLGGAGL
jgi:hypothetical protein